MNPKTPQTLAARWRQVCTTTLLGSSMAALLVACGGGGSDAPPQAGGGSATAQSFAAGPISGLGSIIVNGIRFDDSSARVEDDDGGSHNSRDLKLGMMVEVQSGSIDDNTARASASLVRFGSELKGPVASINAAASTLRVLDQTIEVKSTTVFEDGLSGFAAIAVGQVLEIHAQFDASTGRYTATRIEREGSTSEYRLRGLVSALNATARTFRIGDAVINYAAVPAADMPAAFADGQRVRVRLQTTQANGQWLATGVRTGMRRVEDHSDARLRGLVTAFTSAQQFEVQGVPVDASNASFDPNAAAVRLGALVEVRGPTVNGRVVATRVKVRNERDDDLQRVELHGDVSALDASARTFMLREIRIDYSRVLEWKDGTPADLANGRRVEVKGLWSSDRRTLIAAVIEYES